VRPNGGRLSTRAQLLTLVRDLLACSSMSRPRQIFPGAFYLLTRRCTQRQFLLRPDEITNNTFLYCLIEAARRYEIDVLLPMAEANHHHTVLYDKYGRVPRFVEHFHKMVARCMNARWGRCENLWAANALCLTRLVTREAVIKELIYAASNPVKDLLVDKAIQWPGVNGYRYWINDRTLRAVRPSHFFLEEGAMPAVVELPLTIPPELGDAHAVIAEVKAGVEAVERKVRADRLASGKRVLGRKAILKQSWQSSPKSADTRGALRPRFAGSGPARIAALLEYHQFLSDYAEARSLLLNALPAVFPRGTYWLARFVAVPVVPTPPIQLA
jgi:putative transposase